MDHTGEGAKNTQQLLTYYELDLGLNHVKFLDAWVTDIKWTFVVWFYLEKLMFKLEFSIYPPTLSRIIII